MVYDLLKSITDKLFRPAIFFHVEKDNKVFLFVKTILNISNCESVNVLCILREI